MNQRLSVVRLALSVSSIAAWRFAPKEDFTPNAKRQTLNAKLFHAARASVMNN